jgi:hypothetical protein
MVEKGAKIVWGNTEIDGPDACAATDVEGTIDLLDWRKPELLLQCEPDDVMLEVWPISSSAHAVCLDGLPKRSISC